MKENLNHGMNVPPGMGDMGINTEAGTASQPHSDASKPLSPKVEHDLEEMNRDERQKLSVEQETSIGDSVRTIRECSEGLQTLLLNPDGTPTDLADKEGRERMTHTLGNLYYLTKDIPTNVIKAVKEAIPHSVPTHLDPQDKKLLEEVTKNPSKKMEVIKWGAAFSFFTFLLACCIIFTAIKMIIQADEKEEEAIMKITQAEYQLKFVRDVAIFGNYMRYHNPKTWTRYQNDMDFKSSVEKEYGVK